jgi:hypothetical protein
MLRNVVVVAAATLLALPGVAAGQSEASPYQTAALPFTTTAPGTLTGLTLSIDYGNPNDPSGKPHSVQKLVLRLHPGARIDTSVPEQCKASDAQFAQQGASACPPGSKVGTGETEFDSGSPVEPRIFKTRVTLFNNEDELILFFETTNTPGPPLRVAARARIEDNTITTEVPPLPGFPPPDPFLAVKTVRETIGPVTRGAGASRRSYITTPASCPASGQWTNTLTFTYRDGVTQTVPTNSPCTGTTTRRHRLGIRLSYRGGRLRRSGRRCAVGPVRATVVGPDRAEALRAGFYRGRRRVAYDRRPPLSRIVDRRDHDGPSHLHRLRVRVRMSDGRLVRLARSYRVCADSALRGQDS